MILGNIASVATLILFVFYFIGRIITIVRNRYVFTDELIESLLWFNYQREPMKKAKPTKQDTRTSVKSARNASAVQVEKSKKTVL